METLKQYKPFFLFLAKFFVVYALLTLVYQTYLNQFNEAAFEVDGFTKIVARQTKWFTDLFGYQSLIKPHELQPSIMLILNGNYVARVVEGCNALSVMILFTSFVFAFKGKWSTMLLFIISGAIVIHILNIVRIGSLSIALLYYPKYEHLLHGVLFPAVIYGVVFALWVIWVNKFSSLAKHG